MPKDSSTPGKSIIDEKIWIQLSEICQARSIFPPSIGPESDRTAAHIQMLRRQSNTNDDMCATALNSSLLFMGSVLYNVLA